MKTNPLLVELKKLRESSKDAISHGAYSSLNKFRKYLHIERDVEIKLRSIITYSCESNKAQLLLVCGNVGDGKSHIISHIHDEMKSCISQFLIHNDATESHNPNETSNTTLYKLLQGFRDENIESAKDKIILAINLGTLSKFIEEYGVEFTILKNYISTNKILDADLIHNDEFDNKSFFHHINFTDYHLYSLTENGPKSKLISDLLEKIVSDHESNTIYKEYLNYKAILSLKNIYCPILYNYEFLFNENNRIIITQLIIKAIIKNKEIVSLRTLLNFVHDIIVPVDLGNINESDYIEKIAKMSGAEYISNLIPNYIFEHSELSSLFEKVKDLDPCGNRDAVTDDILLTMINAENVYSIFRDNIDNRSLENIELIPLNSIPKAELSRFFLRLNYFSNYFRYDYLRETDYYEYLVWLFHYNNNNTIYIKKIYELFETAAKNWNGDPKSNGKVVINVGKKQPQYRVFKDFEIVPDVTFMSKKNDELITKFTQEFTLNFKIDNDSRNITIHIDFSLFKILKMVSLGYRPNKKDNNNYLYFVNSINVLINQKNKNAALYIDEVNVGKPIDYKFSKDAFSGYKFQVI